MFCLTEGPLLLEGNVNDQDHQPGAGMTHVRTITLVLALLAGLLATAGAAQAETPPGCASTTQVGPTAYVDYRGQHIASVKWFTGCGKNWSYVYAWQSFVDSKKSFFLTSAMAMYTTPTQPDSDYVGLVHGKTGQRELWSTGVAAVRKCTAALGNVAILSDDVFIDAHTEIRC